MRIGLAIQDSDSHKMSYGCTGYSLRHRYSRDGVYTDCLLQDGRIAVETDVDGAYVLPSTRLKYSADSPTQ